MPARQAGLGRGAGPAGHGYQHLRRALVRRAVERPAHQPRGREGRQLLRRPVQVRRARPQADSANAPRSSHRMWYDATCSGQGQTSSTWSARSATHGPDVEKPNSGWLYTWSLGIPKSSDKKDAAWKFISWMTDKNYIKLVGEELGWERVPRAAGSRPIRSRIPGGVKGLRTVDPRRSRGRQPAQADRATGAVHRGPVPGHPRIPGPRHAGEPADQRRHRRPAVGK